MAAEDSRVVAKELLRSGRKPRDRSERMVVNDYRALQFMREEMAETLSPSFESHAASHRVTHETARTDLRDLAARGLLSKRRKGRKHIFEPAPDLAQRLKESGT